MTDKKEFTGVWIPRYVMEDTDLSPQEKILFADISSFNQCFKLNETFAQQFGVSVSTVKRWIRNLKSKGYVIESGFDGRKRYLQGVHLCTPRQVMDDLAEGSNVNPIDNIEKTNTLSEQSSQNESEEIVIVSDLEEEKGRHRRPAKYPNAPAVRKVFQDVLGRNPANWKTNKTQLQACENLYTERGLDKIKNALVYYKANEDADFIPEINSPYCLDSKWSKLGKHKLKNNDWPRQTH